MTCKSRAMDTTASQSGENQNQRNVQIFHFYFLLYRKISQYLPSELAKVYEKTVHRQTGPVFNPKIFIDFILEDKDVGRTLSDNEKHQLIDRYLEVSFFFY